jgi:hypothetical protein
MRPHAVAIVAIAILATGCGSSSESVEGTTGAATAAETEDTTTTEPETQTSTTPSAEEPGRAETETETTVEPSTGPRVVTIRVVGARPQGGIARPRIDKGETVVLVVSSDVADELHLHGYDVSKPVAAGGTARLRFTATIPGRFELELEERGIQIAELTVR